MLPARPEPRHVPVAGRYAEVLSFSAEHYIERQKPAARLLKLFDCQEAIWPIRRHRLQTERPNNAGELIMDTETADVIGHDVTTITCVCGNTVSQNGLIQCNSQGIPVYIGGNTPFPAGLAKWPEDEDLYTLCPSCGRVYRDTVIEETGTAPVAFRVDVTAGRIAEAIRVHWGLNT